MYKITNLIRIMNANSRILICNEQLTPKKFKQTIFEVHTKQYLAQYPLQQQL
jgi:hypothetical protein